MHRRLGMAPTNRLPTGTEVFCWARFDVEACHGQGQARIPRLLPCMAVSGEQEERGHATADETWLTLATQQDARLGDDGGDDDCGGDDVDRHAVEER